MHVRFLFDVIILEFWILQLNKRQHPANLATAAQFVMSSNSSEAVTSMQNSIQFNPTIFSGFAFEDQHWKPFSLDLLKKGF